MFVWGLLVESNASLITACYIRPFRFGMCVRACVIVALVVWLN